ncbi:tripartite tricarboxylate transporter TctB family protein [Cognatishimia activa]|uniref:Tripartite tricarboxylate transporter TctB family protein n=1 Tax=Cognatishimia activa TaxID=1715691 RepID=A0A0P1IRE4_9RHOB|nr:tripartite tricarboxylate transporter TctB family protein [Cognatishimia activa]CUJ00984.1 Tripartite tricarboxylate transporter TctB family protein [Cognatishimia activa]CUK26188.1 Tripartite tricarboxylate transporter TctB family protein [Cognatishimia activa]
MSRHLNERVFVLLALLLSAVALYRSSLTLSFSDVGSAHSPVFFPQIILVLWIGLTVIALGQTLMQSVKAQPIDGVFRLIILVAASIAYTNLLTMYGFFLTSALFTLICLPVFGMRHPAILTGYAIAVPGALVLLFNHVLGMPLPTSPFTHYF